MVSMQVHVHMKSTKEYYNKMRIYILVGLLLVTSGCVTSSSGPVVKSTDTRPLVCKIIDSDDEMIIKCRKVNVRMKG